jgi:hypothetical protein
MEVRDIRRVRVTEGGKRLGRKNNNNNEKTMTSMPIIYTLRHT